MKVIAFIIFILIGIMFGILGEISLQKERKKQYIEKNKEK